MNVCFAPCLAAIDPNTLKILGFVIVALIYVFNQFVGSAKAHQQRRPPRPDPRLRPPAPGKQEVNDEVAEFLRRTAERTNKRPAEPQTAQPPARRRLVERRLPSEPLPGELVEAETVEEPSLGGGLAARVQQDLASRELGERTSQWGRVEQEERAFDAQVQHAFDHQVGHLARRADEPAAATAPADELSSQSIAALLADPQNLRGAIVLNEILQRPTDRW